MGHVASVAVNVCFFPLTKIHEQETLCKGHYTTDNLLPCNYGGYAYCYAHIGHIQRCSKRTLLLIYRNDYNYDYECDISDSIERHVFHYNVS